MHIVDLSQTIATTMPMFSQTAPRPFIGPWMSHKQALASGNYEGCSCEITQVNFLTSVGTYMDSPFHFNPTGKKIHELRLEQLVLPAVVVDCTTMQARQPILPNVLDGINFEGKAVLFNTGWSRYWGQTEYTDFPFLTEETAIALRDGGAKLAGVDFLVIDDTRNPRRPVHVTLLHSEILIVENLTNLGALPPEGAILYAVPIKIENTAAFPVRAYAIIPE